MPSSAPGCTTSRGSGSGGLSVPEHDLELGQNNIPISTSGGPAVDNFLIGEIEHLPQGIIVRKAGVVLGDLAELVDSWYTNPDILHTCEKKGCFPIGAIKTNRILYPNGQNTSALDYAESLLPDQFHPVTVKGRTYLVHRYEGFLNKIPHAVVLLSYPENAFGQSGALRVFLCSDSSLEDVTILDYYTNRWSIEVMFRSQKRYMGFKSFMVRTVKAFARHPLFGSLFLYLRSGAYSPLSRWLSLRQSRFRHFLILLIYRYNLYFH